MGSKLKSLIAAAVVATAGMSDLKADEKTVEKPEAPKTEEVVENQLQRAPVSTSRGLYSFYPSGRINTFVPRSLENDVFRRHRDDKESSIVLTAGAGYVITYKDGAVPDKIIPSENGKLKPFSTAFSLDDKGNWIQTELDGAGKPTKYVPADEKSEAFKNAQEALAKHKLLAGYGSDVKSEKRTPTTDEIMAMSRSTTLPTKRPEKKPIEREGIEAIRRRLQKE